MTLQLSKGKIMATGHKENQPETKTRQQGTMSTHIKGKKRQLSSTSTEQAAKKSNSIHTFFTSSQTTHIPTMVDITSNIGTSTSDIFVASTLTSQNEDPQPTAGTSTQKDDQNTQEQPKTPTRISDKNLTVFKTLRRISIRHIRAEHHLSYLLQCIENNRNPKGLTTWINPNLPTNDTTFFTDWALLHKEFSTSLTKRLISYWQKVAEDSANEILDLTTALQLDCETTEFDHIQNLIKKYSDRETMNLKDKYLTNSTWQTEDRPTTPSERTRQNNRPMNSRNPRTRQNRQTPQFRTITDMLSHAIEGFLKNLNLNLDAAR
jgi:hypothetical protein